MSWWSDLVGAVESATGLTAAEKTVKLIEGVWSAISDYKLWRSLGWLALGIVLMFLGAAWWIGPSAARRSPLGVAAEGLG